MSLPIPPLPPTLKTPPFPRLYLRASQLVSANPSLTYWLLYQLLDLIISQSLHISTPETITWTTTLMDYLEKTKTKHREDPAYTDDDVARGIVEGFAESTFGRGEKAMRENKVTKATADTLDATATFLSIPSIWSPLSPDVEKKILFCKYHAARILKALRNGEDPNASNPVFKDDPSEPATPTTTDEDLEAGLAEAAASHARAQNLQAATVEDVDDDGEPTIELPGVPDTVAPRDLPRDVPSPVSELGGPEWSRSVSPAGSGGDIAAAAAGGPVEHENVSLPNAPTVDLLDDEEKKILEVVRHGEHMDKQVPVPVAAPAKVSVLLSAPAPAPAYDADSIDTAKAQKHAKWAISALNFDDIATAVQELQNALRVLGAHRS